MMTPVCVKRYVHGVHPSRANPIECGQRSIATSTATMIQVAATPIYNGSRRRAAGDSSPSSSAANIHPHNHTMMGAVTIVCLLHIPSAQDTIAAVVHNCRLLGLAAGSSARTEQYSV